MPTIDELLWRFAQSIHAMARAVSKLDLTPIQSAPARSDLGRHQKMHEFSCDQGV